MSSDNGVYVLKTKNPNGAGFEYRVAHVLGVDNLYYDPETGEDMPRFTDLIANRFFGACEVYTDEDLAWADASEIAGKIGILEYGVSMLEHPRQEFRPMFEEEMEAEEARVQSLVEQHRRQRQEELEAGQRCKEEAAVTISGPGQPMETSDLWGFLITPGGKRVRGNILGRCVVTFPEPVKFLPADWDKERKES